MTFTTNPYADVQQVYSALDLSSSSQTNDGSWIQELLIEAQSDIDRELGFSFQTDGTPGSPSTRLYDGDDTYVLYFYQDRVQAITQVLETTWQLFLSSGVYQATNPVTVDITADCVLQPSYGTDGAWRMGRKTGLPFQLGLQNYQVNGVFGRKMIPSNISRACVRLAVHYYKMRDTNYADQIMEQGMVRMKYNKTVPGDVLEILERYKPRMFYSGSTGTGGSSYGF